MRIAGYTLIGFLAILVLSIFGGSFYTIDQGERGVLLRNGALVGTAEPGLGWKIPFIDSAIEISVQQHSKRYEKTPAYSRDQQPADLDLSVNFRVPPDRVAEVYSDYGSIDNLLSRLVDRRVYEISKTVFGRFNAVTAIQERGRLNLEIAQAIQSAVDGPILIESVQIENIDFSPAYEASIEQRMLAEVEVQKLRQNAEREKVQAEIVVTQAVAKADAVKAQADADAYAVEIKGRAEATAIDVRGKALRDNPALVELVTAERWNGVLPTTIPPNGTVPFLSLHGN